ncbi:pirin-like C-terminal cupin domain-containing protein, partial [Craterilacuibacter sp.]|uniref:pirin-like C-terminal cupin domain-containing protein n=1 Tax=Craterilacuibacter sp. TaxID=2870909 RepID=UPI003F2F892B
HLPAGTRFEQAIPAGHNAFLYTYRGEVSVAGKAVTDRFMAILANDGADGAVIEAAQDARVILVAGAPLNEPIAQYGPFVMNTSVEIQQTLQDYRDGLFETGEVQSL